MSWAWKKFYNLGARFIKSSGEANIFLRIAPFLKLGSKHFLVRVISPEGVIINSKQLDKNSWHDCIYLSIRDVIYLPYFS